MLRTTILSLVLLLALLPFEGKKIAPRTHTVTLQTLSYGEYGFLPPGAYTSTSASAQLGKMYTFRVVE